MDPVFGSIMAASVPLIGQLISGIFDGKDSGGMKRSDWNEVRRLEALSGMRIREAQAISAALGPMAALPGPAFTTALPAAMIAAPPPMRITAARVDERGPLLPLTGPVSPPMMGMNGFTSDMEALKALISKVASGTLMTDGEIKADARAMKFTLADLKRLTSDVGKMTQIWTALGGAWLEQTREAHQWRWLILDKINDAFSHKVPGRRRRRVSVKTMLRSLRQAAYLQKRMQTAAKQLKK